jgi:tRNA (cmo5U34)-methyltransferase
MSQFHFDPDTYLENMRADIPVFDELQNETARATGEGAQAILELGTGTGETARRVITRHPGSELRRDRRERGDAGRGPGRR